MRIAVKKWFKVLIVFTLLLSFFQYVNANSNVASAASFYNEQELFNRNDGKGYGEYRIPSITVTANGTVLAVAEARTGGDQTPTDLVLRRSTDGGNTFSANVILAPGKSQGYAEMNPMLLAENTGSTVHLLWGRWEWGNCKFFIRTSTDNGATWGEARDITSVLNPYKTAGNSKYFANFSAAGMGPGHGFQMSNGVLVVPIYITTSGWTNSTVSLIYSTNGGSTWNAGTLVPNPSGYQKIHENMMVELNDHRLMTNMRNPNSDYRAVSTTNGVNSAWTTPFSDTKLPDPVVAGTLHRYDATTILFANPAHVSTRTNLTIRMSNDDGQSWISRELYAGQNGYSDIGVGPDKTIFVLYEKPAGAIITLARFNKEWIQGGATSGFDPNVNYKLVNRKSGKVADVSGSSTVNGGNVIQWPDSGGLNQKWGIISTGNGYYQIINRNSGKALDVDGASTANSANVHQWTYGGGTNQQWSIVDIGGGYYKIMARHSNKALEVHGGSTADGANLVQYTDNGGSNQQWIITQ